MTPPDPPAAPRRWFAQPLFAALLGMVFILFYWAQAVHVQGRGNPTALINVGREFVDKAHMPHDFGVHVHRGNGFDGQFFLYLASDPLLTRDSTIARLDDPLLRARRIGYPAVLCLLALGHEYSMAATMFLVCALAVGAVAGVLAQLGGGGGPPRRGLLIALAFVFAYPTLTAAHFLTAELQTMALVALAVLTWQAGSARWAALCCALAALSKETAALLPLALALGALLRGDARRAGLFAASVLPLAAWVAWLHWGRGLAFVPGGDMKNVAWPFAGALRRLLEIATGRVELRSGLAVAQVLLTGVLLAAPFVAAVGLWRRRTALWGALLLAALLGATLPSEAAWWFWGNSARQVYLPGVLIPLVFAVERAPLRSGLGALLVAQAAAGAAHLVYYFGQL